MNSNNSGIVRQHTGNRPVLITQVQSDPNHFQFIQLEYPLIHLKFIGSWPDKMVPKIGRELLKNFKIAIDSMEDNPFFIIADLSEFQPSSLKIQDIIAEGMIYCNEHGLLKAIEVLPNAIQRIGINSAERKSGTSDLRIVTKSLEEAFRTYERLKQQLPPV